MTGDRERLSRAGGAPGEVAGEVAADRKAIGTASDEAAHFAMARHLPERICTRLRLVVEELVTNTLEHGGPAAGSTIAYRFEHAPGLITITYADRGRPFDPRGLVHRDAGGEAASGRVGGQGWRIILSWCRIADYRRADDANRLVLEMPVETG